MRRGWGGNDLDLPRHPIADVAAKRRAALAAMFPGERLVLPAGTYKVRANDTEYRFRADTAHTYYCGNQASDAVLVIEDGQSVLYARPSSGRDSDEFFRDRMYGELWVGRRPSLRRGLRLARAGGPPHRRARRRARAGRQDPGPARRAPSGRGAGRRRRRARPGLAGVVSEARLIKDEWEVAELQEACDITTLGFEDVVRDWDNALRYGERWIEGTFFRRARAMGNDIGYDSIVGGGRHATTLHWIENTGTINPGELVLMDMGAEGSNLYTADVTRTMPVDGTFTTRAARPLRPGLYRAAGRDRGRPPRRTVPGRARGRDEGAGARPRRHGPAAGPAEESLDPNSRVYARWTLHGTSHMLGMDVHDCGSTPRSRSIRAATSPRAWCSLSTRPLLPGRRPAGPRGTAAASASASRTTSWSPPTAAANLSAALPRSRRRRSVDGPAPLR